MEVLLDRLDTADWGYPKLIITYRDTKFLRKSIEEIIQKARCISII